MDKSPKNQSEAKGQGLDTSSVFGLRRDKLEPIILAAPSGKETLEDPYGFSDGGTSTAVGTVATSMSPSTGPDFQAATSDGPHDEVFVNDNYVTLVVTSDKNIAKTGVAPANTVTGVSHTCRCLSPRAAKQVRARLKACRP